MDQVLAAGLAQSQQWANQQNEAANRRIAALERRVSAIEGYAGAKYKGLSYEDLSRAAQEIIQLAYSSGNWMDSIEELAVIKDEMGKLADNLSGVRR